VAGRALAFSDPEIVKMAREDYVPVTGDDWYERRRDDEEGKFFRRVADQGPRKGEGGSTRQGIYCLTADGKLLAYKNAGQAPDVMRDVLRQGLAQWRKLPAAQRRPGASTVGDSGATDKRFDRKPPKSGLIVNVFTRILDRDSSGACSCGTCDFAGGNYAARDHLWITEVEWKSLIPAQIKQGERRPMPAALADRITRFHLLDNTRGEPPFWSREHVRANKLTLLAEEVTPNHVVWRLEGSVLLATNADPAKADRGFDVRLLGHLKFNRSQPACERFDIVALGDHWGEGTYTRGARPGRAPLGVAFELAQGDSAADRVPPQAAREISEYLGK
jgi:hypothetical protein